MALCSFCSSPRSLLQKIAELRQLLDESRAATKAAEARMTTLADNNKLLIMELDEKRSLVEAARQAQAAAHKQKLDLMAATEKLKSEMRARDAQLATAPAVHSVPPPVPPMSPVRTNQVPVALRS